MRTNPHRALTPLGLAVLRLLRERPMHPYEVHQVIRDRAIDYAVKVRPGSLYHTFERLHQLTLIEPVETGREGRRPERTVYAITEVGHDAYLDNLRNLVRYPEEEYPVFVTAVEMLRTLDREEAVRLLEYRMTALEARLAADEQVHTSLTKRGLPRTSLLDHEFRHATRRAELEWVRELISEIRSGTLPWTDDEIKESPS
ncbi:PadR family transcriptional regulator [Rugosimonospora africana]|uniref:PadR family transcriptional regulator n=1 Tax=Rugosimonospora africana TaxID=556532 RepID=UPI0019412A78|nr:PadR family transcriptional regulator [Rugosimonospora africana]